MKLFTVPGWFVACCVLLAAACSSSAPAGMDSTIPDIGGSMEIGADDLQAEPDSVAVDASAADSGAKDSASDAWNPDSATDSEVDISSPSADLAPPLPDLGLTPHGDTCYNPIPLTWKGNKLTWNSGLHYGSSYLALPASAPKTCVDGATAGVDVFFTFQVPTDGRYLIRAGYAGAVTPFVFTNCGQPLATCVHQDPLESLLPEARVLNLKVGVDYLLGVANRSTSANEIYPQVSVEPAPVPANDTCSKASRATFVNGVARLSYRLDYATNTNANHVLPCPRGALRKAETSGAEQFYRVFMNAGSVYSVAPSWGAQQVYVLSGCTAPSCLAGYAASTHTVAAGVVGLQEAMLFRPSSSGDYIVVVDSVTPFGGFGDVLLHERTPPPRDTCAGAERVSVIGATAKVSGSFAEMHDDSYAPQGCPTIPLPGAASTWKDDVTPEVFYRFFSKRGQVYYLRCTSCLLQAAASCAAVERQCAYRQSYDIQFEGGDAEVFLRVEGEPAKTYQVDVEVSPVASHSSCATAKVLAWSGLQIREPLDFRGAVVTSATGCHRPKGELYFDVPVKAGRYYRVQPRLDVHVDWMASCQGSVGCRWRSGWSLQPTQDHNAKLVVWYDGIRPPVQDIVVEQAPEHVSCDRPRPLAFTNGQVRVDETRHAWFPVSTTPTSCTNPRSLYYSFAVKAGKQYSLSFDTSTRAALTMDAHSCAASPSALCSLSYMSGPKHYSAATDGTWLLRVDAEAVAFTLNELP